MDLIVARLREVDRPGRPLDVGPGGFERVPGDHDLGPRRDRLGELGLGQLEAGLGGVVRPGRFLLLPEGPGAGLLEVREPLLVVNGQEQVGLGGLHAGPGLVDPLLDVVVGEHHRGLRLRSSRDRRLQGPPGDLDLDRDLAPQAGEVGLLPVELPLGGLQPRRGHVDLVAVGDRVDLRHHLALLDPVALVNDQADDPARDQLRRRLTMWASTKASSVIESEARPCHQRRTTRTVESRHRDHHDQAEAWWS